MLVWEQCLERNRREASGGWEYSVSPPAGHTWVCSPCTKSYDMHTFYINVNLEVYLDLNEWALGCLQTTPVGNILVHTPCAEMETFL